MVKEKGIKGKYNMERDSIYGIERGNYERVKQRESGKEGLRAGKRHT